MTERLPLPGRVDRFPGMDVLGQRGRWDAATRRVVERRTQPAPRARFFLEREHAAARRLLDRLVGQPDDAQPYVDVVGVVDTRLFEGETDGWHYDTMPPDRDAWRASLRGLDDDAVARYGRRFADCDPGAQREIIEAVRTCAAERWHDLPPAQLWSLWTRYAMTAFYAHPAAWNEIGFPGPAYPRGYRHLGIGAREPFEVRDTTPREDPLGRGRPS